MALITVDYFSNALRRSTTFKLLLPEYSPEETVDNYIGGMSMSGYGALHTALAYPERFDAVASFSAALIQREIETMKPGYDNGMANYAYYCTVFGAPEEFSHSPNNPDFQVTQLLAQGKALPRIFLCVGTEDPLVYEANQLFRRFLTEKDVDFTYLEAPGVHDFRFADRHLEQALQFLTGEE